MAAAKKQTKDLIPPSVTLPDDHLWAKGMNVQYGRMVTGRITISRPSTASLLAEAFVPEGSKDKVIIEAYPGPGLLTRGLLDLPRERIKKIILLEPTDGFVDWLEPLREHDDRVVIMKNDPYNWQTFDLVADEGHLADVPIVDWKSGLHPNLQFIQHMPSSVIGEQLLSQYIRTIPDRMWLFKYGRVPLDLITTGRMWQVPYKATEKHPLQRCKIGVLGQATSEVELAVPPRRMDPYDLHFWPKSRGAGKANYNMVLESRKTGNPHIAMRLTPLEEPLIKSGELDVWDYVTRKLFISKATPVSKSIQGLGPGATGLLKALTDPALPLEQQLDVTKPPRSLNVHEWKLIADAFEKWPFRPDNLSIDVDLLPYGKESRK
ncbi:S-adenosyl-L-methionine-dependent methyltransferase [Coprinopsis sp. MPI-PUGE-AT-0042]|nr:S-adenosyl-L-methionine-dependent methyltransferase [Coprinopsis sp. MPI-PUGE-AT-0042]